MADVMDNPVEEPEIQLIEEPSHLEDIFNQKTVDFHNPENDEQGLSPETEEGAEENAEATEDTEENAEPSISDEVSQLREQMEALQKRYDDAQSFIAKQGNEIGDLRKASQQPDLNSEEYLNKFAEDPVAAQRELLEHELSRREAEAQQRETQVQNNKSAILKHIPEFESHLDGIREWYKGKGASDEFIANLNMNTLSGNVDLAVALGENQLLQKQLAETKSANKQVLSKVNKGTSIVNGKSGYSASSDKSLNIPSDVTSLSDKQLKEMLRRASA